MAWLRERGAAWVWCFVLLTIAGVTGCDKSGAATPSADVELLKASGPTMGTFYQVTIANPPANLSDDWKFEIDAELRRVNDQMSTYLKSSELSRFNEQKSDQWFSVSQDTATVVAAAIEISEQTGGAFDVTVGPLVDLWSFGAAERTKSVPTEQQITAAQENVGYQSIESRIDPPALRKTKPEIRIDLSSIAKGHGVDRVLSRLKKLRIDNAFVNIGGEIGAIGDKGTAGSWNAGVERPGGMGILFPVPLKSEAIATSGDYRNFFEVDGQRYSHTIDPRTGRPVKHNLALVSIVSDSCMIADAWATALSVLGPAEGQKAAAAAGLDAFLMERFAEEKKYEPYSVGRFVNWYQAAIPK